MSRAQPGRVIYALRAARRWLGTQLRRGRDLFPLTPLGGAVAVGSFLCWERLGVERLDYVLTLIGLVGMALAGASVLLVALVTVWWWWLERRGRPGSAMPWTEVGQLTVTGASCPSFRWLPLIKLSWEWIDPTGVEVSLLAAGPRLVEQVKISRRGVHGRVLRRCVVEDSLGLSRMAFRAEQTLDVPLRVLPDLGQLRQHAVVSALAGGDELPHPLGTQEGDRLELRQYQRGDPARLIVWKVFGRTRRLVVRTPERALARTHAVAAYLVTGPGDEAPAAAARLAVETGALGAQWVLGADQGGADARQREGALELIAGSGSDHEGEGEATGLRPFMERNERHGSVKFVVFAPAREGRWVERLAGIAGRRPGFIEAVVVGDGLRQPERRSWRGIFWRVEAVPVAPLAEVEALSRRLAGRGIRVTVVDRLTGKTVQSASLGRKLTRVA